MVPPTQPTRAAPRNPRRPLRRHPNRAGSVIAAGQGHVGVDSILKLVQRTCASLSEASRGSRASVPSWGITIGSGAAYQRATGRPHHYHRRPCEPARARRDPQRTYSAAVLDLDQPSQSPGNLVVPLAVAGRLATDRAVALAGVPAEYSCGIGVGRGRAACGARPAAPAAG